MQSTHNPAEVRTLIAKGKEIRIRISQADKERLQQAAMLLGISVSDFIRSNAQVAANTLQTERKQGD